MKIIQKKAQLLLLGCIPLYGACKPSSPHTERQTRDDTSVLSPTSIMSSLNLTGDGSETIYFEGPLLFWKNDVSHVDMTQLLKEKDKIVVKELAYKPNAYQLDGLVKESKSLKKEIDILKQGGFFGIIDEKSKETIETTSAWIANKISDTTKFNQFCQAYLWKTASSFMIRNFEFTQRPMILSVCQNELKDYFTSDECTSPENGASKSYLSCFWGTSGIQKTDMRYFKIPEGGTRTSRARVSESEKQRILDYFQTDDWFTEPDGIKQLLTSGVGEFYIKNSDGSKSKFFAAFTDSTQIREMIQFVIKKKIDPNTYKNFVIDNSNSIDALKKLTEEISNGSYTYTLNDFMYNFNSQRKANDPDYRAPTNANDLKRVQEITNLHPDYKDLFTNFSTEEISKIESDILDPIAIKERSYEALKKTVIDLDHKQTDLRKKWYDQKTDAVYVLIRKEMTEAIWAYSELRLTINGTTGEFLFRPAYATKEKYYFAKACIDLEANQAITCKSFKEREFPMKLEIDQSSGKLSFDIEPDPDQQFYLSPFDPVEKDPAKQKFDEDGNQVIETPFFQSEMLTREFLNNHRLRMEIFPDVYKNQIPRMTGKLFLYTKSGEKVLDGEFGQTKSDLLYAYDTIDKGN